MMMMIMMIVVVVVVVVAAAAAAGAGAGAAAAAAGQTPYLTPHATSLRCTVPDRVNLANISTKLIRGPLRNYQYFTN